jgi:hypothetical protein
MACKRQAHGAKTGYAALEEPICGEKTGYICGSSGEEPVMKKPILHWIRPWKIPL